MVPIDQQLSADVLERIWVIWSSSSSLLDQWHPATLLTATPPSLRHQEPPSTEPAFWSRRQRPAGIQTASRGQQLQTWRSAVLLWPAWRCWRWSCFFSSRPQGRTKVSHEKSHFVLSEVWSLPAHQLQVTWSLTHTQMTWALDYWWAQTDSVFIHRRLMNQK